MAYFTYANGHVNGTTIMPPFSGDPPWITSERYMLDAKAEGTTPQGISLILANAAATGQEYVISTYAGGGPPPSSFRGADLSVGTPQGVVADTAGNLYFTGLNCVFKLDQNDVVTRIAGNSQPDFSGDGGPAISASLSAAGLALDAAGNLFIADARNNRIRRASPDGIVVTVAGIGSAGFSGDRSPAVSAEISGPTAVAVDESGNLFIADSGNSRIRQVSAGGIITTVAGNGVSGFFGDGGPAASASLAYPTGVAVDGAGDLFIADYSNHRIREVLPNGIITTVAGGGTNNQGDGGLATAAFLAFTAGVAMDGAGNLFIAEFTDCY